MILQVLSVIAFGASAVFCLHRMRKNRHPAWITLAVSLTLVALVLGLHPEMSISEGLTHAVLAGLVIVAIAQFIRIEQSGWSSLVVKANSGLNLHPGLILDSLSEGIILTDCNNRMFYVNRRMETMCGYSAAELLGRPGEFLVSPEDRARARQKTQERLTGVEDHYDLRFRTKGGDPLWVELSSVPYKDPSGEIIGTLSVVTEITDRVDRGQEILKLAAFLETNPNPVLSCHADGKLTYENSAATSWMRGLGVTAEEVLPADHTELARRCIEEQVSIRQVEHSVGNRALSWSYYPVPNVGMCQIYGEDDTARRMADAEQLRLTTAVDQSADAVIITDLNSSILYVNPSFEQITGFSRYDVVGQTPKILESGRHNQSFYKNLWSTLKHGEVWRGTFQNKRKDGSIIEVRSTITPVRDQDGQIINYVCVSRDLSKEQDLEAQLRQAQKLEAIGQLAAGIAHEINTPTQYIGDNTRFLRDGFKDIAGLLVEYENLLAAISREHESSEGLKAVQAKAAEIDLEFLLNDIPESIDQTLEGVERVSTIVRAMKEFSHPGSSEPTPTDLNAAIETTVTVARNEWKYVADVEKQLDPSLPTVPCLPGEFNQTILNMIVNAAHAIADKVDTDGSAKGTITISTKPDGSMVEIRVSDTGVGIPPELREKVFDPFFTTKKVGKGTGQGLAIAHNVIVDKLGGTISMESEVGQGTTMIIRLPATTKEKEEAAK